MTTAWQTLNTLSKTTLNLRDCFPADAKRQSRFCFALNDLTLDLSKNHLNADILKALLALCEEKSLNNWMTRLAKGETVNHTENRAACHMALRDPNTNLCVNGEAIQPQISASLSTMRHWADQFRQKPTWDIRANPSQTLSI